MSFKQHVEITQPNKSFQSFIKLQITNKNNEYKFSRELGFEFFFFLNSFIKNL